MGPREKAPLAVALRLLMSVAMANIGQIQSTGQSRQESLIGNALRTEIQFQINQMRPEESLKSANFSWHILLGERSISGRKNSGD